MRERVVTICLNASLESLNLGMISGAILFAALESGPS